MFAIETTRLQKQYGSHNAVNSLDLKIPVGSVCGFLGKNGAGKTTTLKMLVGLSRPTSGKILLLGRERVFGRIDNSDIGYLPDVPNFYDYFSAAEYLNFCGKLYGMDKRSRSARIKELLKKVGLEDTKAPVAGYSRGMKQRLGIAGALMNSPAIIFLDEPVSALDPLGRREIMDLVRSLHGRVTVILSTHILSDVEKTCDYIVIMEHGNLITADTTAKIKSEYTGNSARLRLCTAADCDRFLSILKNYSDVTATKSGLNELKLCTTNIAALHHKLPELLCAAEAGIEHFEIFSPSIEDIFMEVTSNE